MLEHWYAALASERGIVVSVDEGSVDLAKAKLYKARADAADPDLERLSLVPSPTGANEIWIVKKDPSNG